MVENKNRYVVRPGEEGYIHSVDLAEVMAHAGNDERTLLKAEEGVKQAGSGEVSVPLEDFEFISSEEAESREPYILTPKDLADVRRKELEAGHAYIRDLERSIDGTPLAVLGLGARAVGALTRIAGFKTVEEVRSAMADGELGDIRTVGPKIATEIRDKLAAYDNDSRD